MLGMLPAQRRRHNVVYVLLPTTEHRVNEPIQVLIWSWRATYRLEEI